MKDWINMSLVLIVIISPNLVHGDCQILGRDVSLDSALCESVNEFLKLDENEKYKEEYAYFSQQRIQRLKDEGNILDDAGYGKDRF